MFAEFLATVIALPVCIHLLPGLHCVSTTAAICAGAALGVIYLILRKPLHILTAPLGCISFGLFGTIVDALLIQLCAYLMAGELVVDSFWWAVAAALVVNVVRGFLAKMLGKKEKRHRYRDDDWD